MQGRCIRDCINLTSKAVNLLYKKSYGGNLVMKVDISKAFDSLDWLFLTQVLRKFGFHEISIFWIWAIFKSTKVTISLNGKMHGYFDCERGVR